MPLNAGKPLSGERWSFAMRLKTVFRLVLESLPWAQLAASAAVLTVLVLRFGGHS
jgi:hypothetical protein